MTLLENARNMTIYYPEEAARAMADMATAISQADDKMPESATKTLAWFFDQVMARKAERLKAQKNSETQELSE